MRSFLLLLISVMLIAAEPLPAGGVPLLATAGDGTMPPFMLTNNSDGPAELATVAVEGMPFASAWRMRSGGAHHPYYRIEVKAAATAPVRAGSTLHLRCWYRGIDIPAEHEVSFIVGFQRIGGDWRKALYRERVGRQEWQLLDIPFNAVEDLPAGGSELTFVIGRQEQTIEVGGLQLLDYGDRVPVAMLPATRITYAGRERDAPWRAAAAERIERLRKGDLTVRVADAHGRPVAGARIAVRMERHAFGFGTVVNAAPFNGEPSTHYLTRQVTTYTAEESARYRAEIAANFNLFSTENGYNWGGWRNPAQRAREDAMAAWCLERGLAWNFVFLSQPRNYAEKVAWTRLYPQFEGDPAGRSKAILAEAAEKVAAFRGKVARWDAINHCARWVEETFPIEDQARIIRQTRELDPGTPIYVNENYVLAGGDGDGSTVMPGTTEILGNRRASLADKLARLAAAGAAPDIVAFQSHFDHNLTGIPKILALLDRFGALAGGLMVDEFDMSTGDEEVEGDYLRDFLTACFSHPQMVAWTMWGFWDGCHWKGNAPIYRRDWSLKPSGRAWKELVQGAWWTSADGVSTAEAFRVRGFCGAYAVTASLDDGRTATVRVELGRSGSDVTVTLP